MPQQFHRVLLSFPHAYHHTVYRVAGNIAQELRIGKFRGTPPILTLTWGVPYNYICMCGWSFTYSLCEGYCVHSLASHPRVRICMIEQDEPSKKGRGENCLLSVIVQNSCKITCCRCFPKKSRLERFRYIHDDLTCRAVNGRLYNTTCSTKAKAPACTQPC